MTDEQNMDMMTEGSSLTWIETWIKALTQPSVETYEEIAADPNATTRRAYNWIFITGFISTIVSIGLGGLGADPLTGSGAGGGSTSIFFLVCIGLVAPLFLVLSIMISAGITQAIAGALGGTGSYTKLIYAFAAYIAPLSMISTALSIIPFASLLTIPLAFYGIVLNLMANRAVNQFGWGKAIASSFILLMGLMVLVALLVIVVLALLGPAIGNIFSGIMSSL